YDGLRVEADDTCAGMALVRDEPFSLEAANSLPHRNGARAEFAREVVYDKPIARAIRPVGNALPHVLIRRFLLAHPAHGPPPGTIIYDFICESTKSWHEKTSSPLPEVRRAAK